MNPLPRLMIAAPASGSGKSVIAAGLMAAFSRRFPVQGFKVGPDYIDPMYHTLATGRPSRNLDSWMLSTETLQKIFLDTSQGASLSIIEGVMGLFDGYGSDPFEGSSASIAHLLKIPIILVVDCSKMSGSAAAVVHGFNSFCNSLHLAGVICNRVGSQTHCSWLMEAIEKRTHLPVLGCIPKLPVLQIPERHLGLFTVAERPAAVAEFLQQAAEVIEQHLDLDTIKEIADSAEPLPCPLQSSTPHQTAIVKIAVAQDEAFCFYYEDNLDELRRSGGETLPFSPLRDDHLPEGISGIYIGGGYPEIYAKLLSENQAMRSEIARCHAANMPIYAECGGLMYLTEGIQSEAGHFPMVGILPGWCRMASRLTMGYRQVKTVSDALLAPANTTLRGHEFHYSEWHNPDLSKSAYLVQSRKSHQPQSFEGYQKGNLLASYIHLHFAQNHQIAKNFVRACYEWHLKRN